MRWLALALAGCALLLLRAAEQTPDALDYALAAREGSAMWHPHHLIYVPATRLLMEGIAPLAGRDDAILAAQIHNVIWAMVALAAVWSMARRWLGSTGPALVTTVALLTTRGFWVYATQGESYLPATGCLLAAGSVAFRPAARWRRFDAAMVSLLLAAAVLYHQTSALFVAPLAAAILGDRGGGRAARARRLLAIVGPAVLLVLIVYMTVYLAQGDPTAAQERGRSAIGFARFCLSYALAPVPTWGAAEHLGGAGWLQLLRSQAVNVIAWPEDSARLQALLFAAAAAVLVFWHLGQILAAGRRRRLAAGEAGPPSTAERRALLIWLLGFWLFFLWWLPSDTDFFVATLVPLVLLTALLCRDVASGARRFARAVVTTSVVLAIAVMAGVNLWATVLPLHRSPGPAYAEAAALAAAVAADCRIVTDYATQQNLRYHFRREDAIELDAVTRSFQTDPDAEQPWALLRRDCAVLPLRELSIGSAMPSSEGDRFRGETFLAWLLWGQRAERGPPALGTRPIALLAGDQREPYVALSAEGAAAPAPPYDLREHLEELAARVLPEQPSR